MTEQCYIAVKASLHSSDSSVFGLSIEEISALSKRYPDTKKEVINGVLIKASPLQVINSLSEIGYKVVCSSGETEIVWTLRREVLIVKGPNLPRQHGSSKALTDDYGTSAELKRLSILAESGKSLQKESDKNPPVCRLNGSNMEHRCQGHAPPPTPSAHQTLEEMDFERGLWHAAMTGDLTRVCKLLDKGHHPDEEDKSGYTALHYAARSGYTEICSRLIQSGAKVDATTRAGKATPLQRAALAGKSDVVNLLVKRGADVDKRDQDGRTALHRAVEGGNPEVVGFLLEVAPRSAHRPDDTGKTPDQCTDDPKIRSLFFP